MSTGLYSTTTRATGSVLTAAIYNADHVNHVTNQNPSQTGAYSDNVPQMQSAVDPGEVGSEALASSLAGELERLRFSLNDLKTFLGLTSAQWYSTPTGLVSATKVAAPAVAAITGNITLTAADIRTQKNVTAAADITIPTAASLVTGDVIRFKSSTEAKVQLLRQSTDTIDGDTAYLIPSYTTVELMKSAAGVFILSQRPSVYVGMMIPHGSATIPRGWIGADTATPSRTAQGGLFSVYGTTHGVGDGALTFGIPNMQRKAPIGAGGAGTATVGNAVGNSGGEEGHALTSGENGPHTHSDYYQVTNLAGGGNISGATGDFSLSEAGASTTTGSSGSGTAHNTMQPSYVMNFIIKT